MVVMSHSVGVVFYGSPVVGMGVLFDVGSCSLHVSMKDGIVDGIVFTR